MQDFKHDLTSRGSESNCPVVITSFSSKIVAKTKCPRAFLCFLLGVLLFQVLCLTLIHFEFFFVFSGVKYGIDLIECQKTMDGGS